MDADLREQILQNAYTQFAQHGLKFTMQDIAVDLHVAKKTMYRLFASKEDLLNAMIDSGFRRIHEEKAKIIDSDLPVEEKIRRVVIAFPANLTSLDYRKLDELDLHYPAVAANMRKNLETNWEPTLQLIEEGIREGRIRPVNVPVLRMMITASFETFVSTENLEKAGIEYHNALEAMMDIIMGGIQKGENNDTARQ